MYYLFNYKNVKFMEYKILLNVSSINSISVFKSKFVL